MPIESHLRDLLYLDEEKAASIYSQIFGGLIEGTQESSEQQRDRRRGIGLNIGPLRPEIGSSSGTRTSVIESRVLHHDLLLEIERGLTERRALVDLNEALVDPPMSEAEIRATLDSASYVRAEGWATIEDYERISNVAGEFGPLVEFINRCVRAGVEKSEEYKALRIAIEEQKAQARALADKQQRGRALREVAKGEEALNTLMTASISQAESLDDWLVEGIQRWIRVFLPGRITLRLYPFEAVPRFQVFGNLKPGSFVDTDLGNLLFAYGARPNVKLTLVGLITSMPAEIDARFDPLTEFNSSEKTSTVGVANESEASLDASPQASQSSDDQATFEQGFRGVFRGMEEMESLVRYSRYPNVTVYPLAVYRRVPVVELPVASQR